MDAPPVQYARTHDGYDIAWCAFGEGAPLLMMPEPFNHLHLMWSSPLYRSLYLPLAERFQVVQFDARGQGLSSRGLRPGHTHRSHLDDLEAVIHAAGLSRFVLYGGYYFGTVAAEYAARNPQQVAALILWNIDRGEPMSLNAIIGDLRTQSWDLFVETYARTFNAYEDTAAAVGRLRASMDQLDSGVYRDPGWDVTEMLRSIKVPTLVVARRSSALALEESGRRVASLVANSRFVLFDDIAGGRYTSDGSTPALVTAIDTFLASLPDAATLRPADARQQASTPDALSTREIEVLRLLAAGHTNQQIADDLVISLNTVRRHVSNIFDKTGAANRAQAAVYARDHGLV
jgi:DNA-binding NarL/FixJ family response regulator